MTLAEAMINFVMVGTAVVTVGAVGLLVAQFREARRDRAAARDPETEVSYPKKTSASA